jgi:hemolysin activation/secretion protein
MLILKRFFFLLILFFVNFLLNHISFATPPSANQQMSGQERARQMEEESEKLQNQIEQPRSKIKPEEKTTQQLPSETPAEQKVLIKSIEVSGVTLFKESQIKAITAKYESKELTLGEMQKIADQITDMYRSKGYVISRAYVPAQKIENGILEIMVIESRIGDIQLKGNRFYSTRLIESYLTIKKGEFFNYNDLKCDLNNINDHPDRVVRSVLIPGNQPGTTDIVLNERDSLPIHVQVGYNDYLSRYLRTNLYSSTFIDNNLLGQDDILTFDYERGDNHNYYSYTTNYLYPVTKGLDLGIYASRSKEVMAGEFAAVGAQGKSNMYGLYGSQNLIKNDGLSSKFNFGFDYVDVFNFLEGSVSSQDRLRIVKSGLDFDIGDDFGRTLISDDFNYGIPDFMDGTKEDLNSTDIPTSRAGAGGEFVKDTLNILRLQQLPFNSTLLWRNQLQFSSSTLTSTEQFQIGGPANNRGYPVADAVGDEGYSMSWELAQPPYFIPRSWVMPYSNTSIYDDVRVIEFYDWSNVHSNSVQPGEQKDLTLSSAGCGLRLNILRNLSATYQVGWPLMGRSSDGKGVQNWFETTVTF